jgi:hypothetical protein
MGLGPGFTPVVAQTAVEAVEALIETFDAADPGRLILISGAEADSGTVASLVERVGRRWPSARIEAMAGAQPRYPYLVGYVPDPKPR